MRDGESVWTRVFHATTEEALRNGTTLYQSDAPIEDRILAHRWYRVEDKIRKDFVPDAIWTFQEIKAEPMDVASDPAWIENHQFAIEAEALPPIPFSKHERPWNVTPDVAGELPSSLLRKPVPIATGSIYSACLSATGAPQAAVVVNDMGGLTLHRCDLRRGRIVAKTLLPRRSKVLDIRPDARVYVTGVSEGDRKLQVWQCSIVEDRLYLEIQGDYDVARFVGPQGLLVKGKRGLKMYRLPGAEILYEIPATDFQLSWNRKYFFATHDERYCIYRASDGTLAGELESPPGQFRPARGAAFHPNGKLLAVSIDGDYVTWDLDSGELVKRFSVPFPADTLRWCDENHLFTGSFLVDVAKEMYVWKYAVSRIAESPRGRICFSLRDDGVDHLCAIQAPSQAVTDALENVFKRPGLAPSEAVSLEIEIGEGVSQRATTETRMLEMIREKLAAEKLDLSGEQPQVLSIDVVAKRPLNVLELDIDGQTKHVLNSDLTATIAFGDRDADAKSQYWIKHIVVSPVDVHSRVNLNADDLAAEFANCQIDEMMHRISQMELPMWNLPAKSFRGFGTSELTIWGESILVNAEFD